MKYDISTAPDFGYLFASHSHEGLHGHTRLDVRLSEQPSYQHFDPEEIEVIVKMLSDSGTAPQLEELRLTHPWSGPTSYEGSCGHIFIYDRKGKKVDAFTFGCTIHLHTEEDTTRVVFESPTPIFEVTPVNPVIDLWIDEVEILLAMRRAAWLKAEPHLHFYEERLCQARPMDLYVACLLGVQARLTHISEGVSEIGLRLRNSIRTELHWLIETGEWAGERKRLEDVA